MRNALRITRGVVFLTVVAFIALVIWGVYTALDAAPHASLPASTQAVAGEGGEAAPMDTDRSSNPLSDVSAASDASAAESNVEDVVIPAEEYIAPPANGSGTGSPLTGTTSDDSTSSRTGSSATNNAASSAANGAGAGSGASSGAATPDTPQQTWHPAWDEWVESGYWEDRTVPATCGQREVYGSICNECGENISGHASRHLKETHHSGYHEGVVGYETYEITPARTEHVWIDTSHWVHHAGYWS